MRWLVEATPLGTQEARSTVVEAETWQKALQAAREARGEGGPMAGFSVELLSDGYRAVDPASRVRYVVKQAPPSPPDADAAAKPAPAAAEPKAAAQKAGPAAKAAPAASSPAKAAGTGHGSASKPAAAPAPAPAPAAAKSAKADRPSSGKGHKAGGPPRPGVTTGAGAAAASLAAAPAAATRAEPPASATLRASVPDDPPSGPLPARTETPAVGAQLPGLPPCTVALERKQEPSDAMPFTYREYAFTVPEGTTPEQGAELLRAQLQLVEAQVGAARTRKIVNLAVFDVAFTGKPPRPPLATLAWKDWKGEPVVSFPSSGAAPPSAGPPSRVPSSMPPPSAFAQQPVEVPRAPAAPQGLTPGGDVPPALAQIAALVGAAAPAAASAPPPALAPSVAPAAVAPAAAAAVVPSPTGTAPLPAPAAADDSSNALTQPRTLELLPEPSERDVARVAAAPAFPEPPAPAAAPAFPAPAPAATAAAPAPAPAPAPPPDPAPAATDAVPAAGASGRFRTPSGKFERGRATADELIGALFEATHDLHFLKDAVEGAWFCLDLLHATLPTRSALVHFYDMDRRGTVVAAAVGAHAGELVGHTEPALDDTLRDFAKRKTAGIARNVPQDASLRHARLGGVASAAVAPFFVGGRLLGFLELVDPADGVAFRDDEAHAVGYVAEQYAEFLSSRGIVLDRSRILAGKRA